MSWKTVGIVLLATLACPCSWPAVALFVGWFARAIGLAWPITLGLLGGVVLSVLAIAVLWQRLRGRSPSPAGDCCGLARPASSARSLQPITQTPETIDGKA